MSAVGVPSVGGWYGLTNELSLRYAILSAFSRGCNPHTTATQLLHDSENDPEDDLEDSDDD